MDFRVFLEGKAVQSRRGRAAVTGTIGRIWSISRTISHCIVDSSAIREGRFARSPEPEDLPE